MRSAASAFCVLLLAGAAVKAQPAEVVPRPASPESSAQTLAPAIAPAQYSSAPAPYPSANPPATDPALASQMDAITGTNPWKMSGPRAWASAEYLLWWERSMATPPLIQTVPAAAALGSVINNSSLPPGVAQRYFPGNDTVHFGSFSGIRGSAGVNFDRFGIDINGFILPQQTKNAGLFNNGTPYSVAESYIRAGTGTPVSLLASAQGQSSGGISSAISSQLWGMDGNIRLPFYNFLTDTTDALVGFRYIDLQEKIGTNFVSRLNNGTGFLINESVQTRNQFYGGQVGLNGKINGVDRGIGFDGTSKIALGSMQQHATLLGTNSIQAPGMAPSVQPGGVYASGLNYGSFNRGQVAMVLEENLNVTYNLNRWAQVYVGYSLIYISSVARPGKVIDPVVNDANLRFVANPPANTTPRPQFHWNATDFWAQGINFGVRLQY